MRALVAASALLVGLLAGALRGLHTFEVGAVGLVALAALLLVWRLPPARWIALATLCFALGAARVAAWPMPTTDDLRERIGSTVALHGTLMAAPQVRGEVAIFRVQAQSLASGTLQAVPAGRHPVAGRVEVVAPVAALPVELTAGDVVEVRGRLAEPTSPPGFPRAELLRRQGVFTTMQFPSVNLLRRGDPPFGLNLDAVRAGLERRFHEWLPDPQAGLALGMLLGGSQSFPPEFRLRLQAAGLGHLVAVSGYNIVVVAGAVHVLMRRTVGIRYALVPTLVAIGVYTALVGGPPSAVRAALMVGAALVATSIGRIADPLTGVVAAACAMALHDPQVLFDVGFQLSVSATLGLVLLYPRIRLHLGRLPGGVADALALAIAAELATLPFVLATFRQVSLIAPLANLLAAPLVPAIMLASGLLAVALPAAWLATVVAPLTWLATTLLVLVVDTTGGLPFASMFLGTLPPEGAAMLALLLLLWGLLGLPEAAVLRERLGSLLPTLATRRGLAVGALAAFCLGAASAPATLGGEHLQLSLLPGGEGRSVFVRSPSGQTALVVDGHIDPRGTATTVADRLRPWERGLTWLVPLNPGAAAAAAEVARRYPPSATLTADSDARLELGAGVVLDVHEGGAATLTFGDVWIQLGGQPPPTAPRAAAFRAIVGGRPPDNLAQLEIDRQQAIVRTPLGAERIILPQGLALDLASDGSTVWLRDAAD